MSRALIIEGHRGLRSAISNLLKGMGIESIETDGLSEIEHGDIDLVIVGILYKRLVNTNIPTIVMTPFEKINSKNIYYVRLPFEIDKLCDVIKELTNKRPKMLFVT